MIWGWRPCFEVRIALMGEKWGGSSAGRGRRRLGSEEIGSALGGARVRTEEGGSHRCSTAAAKMCRRDRRKPGRAPPSPRHSHRRPPLPQPGPGPPPRPCLPLP